MIANVLLMSVLCFSIGSCVSSDDGSTHTNTDSDGEVDVDFDGPSGQIVGRVWAPGNAPGMVPDTHEIPILGALVWLTHAEPSGIPQRTYCDSCETTPGASTFTSADGSFSFDTVAPGQYWLNIRKGQFRRSQQIHVEADAVISLQSNQTTLPSVHDPKSGKWLPKMALVDGTYDALEDVLGKMKVGQVDARGEFVGPSAIGVFDIYRSEGRFRSDSPTPYAGSAEELFGDLQRMLSYHIIFIPCDSSSETLIYEKRTRDNIREFVRQGGKLYVTDWSSEFEDGVFPEYIVFDESHDTESSEDISLGDGRRPYSSLEAYAANSDLNAWLDLQTGPDAISSGDKPIDADKFHVEGNWNRIVETPRVFVGGSEEGLNDYETATHWVLGDWEDDGIMHPLTVTFEPEGCGRVLYSTYHTTDDTHVGLTPQERVLLFLIMEIGECRENAIIE